MSNCRVCEATTDGFLCRPCLSEIERAIGDLPSLMHELSNVATGQTNVYRANGKPEVDSERAYDPEADLNPFLRSPHGRTALRPTRLMVRLDARELMWVAGSTMSGWALHLAESRGVKILPDEPKITPMMVVGWLLKHVAAIRFDEAAAEMHDEFTTLHRDLERAVDRSPSRVYVGPCHADLEGKRCERDLYAWPGAFEIVCDGFRGDEIGCRSTHTALSRRGWLVGEIEFALLPLADWQQALPRLFPELTWPPRQTWWRWAEDGGRHQRLFAVSQDRVGTPTYRGGDVLDVVRRAQGQLATRGGRRSA